VNLISRQDLPAPELPSNRIFMVQSLLLWFWLLLTLFPHDLVCYLLFMYLNIINIYYLLIIMYLSIFLYIYILIFLSIINKIY